MAARQGTLIASPIRIQDDNIPVAVAFAKEIKGGVHSGTLAEMSALPAYYREFGMVFTVMGEVDPLLNGIYVLKNNSGNVADNANWIKDPGVTPTLQAVSEAGPTTTEELNLNGGVSTTDIVSSGKTALGGSTATGAGAFANGEESRALAPNAVALGKESKSLGNGAVALGISGVANDPGEVVVSSGRFSAIGDAQSRTHVFRIDQWNNTTDKMISGDSLALVADIIDAIALPDDSYFHINIEFVGVNITTGDHVSGTMYLSATKLAGVLSLHLYSPLYSTVTTTLGSTHAFSVADDGTGNIALNVTGATGQRAKWVAKVNILNITLEP